MKNKVTKILILFLIIVLGIMINSYARVSSTDPSTTSGGEVTITLKSSETIYAYKVSLSDSDGLTFVSATSAEGQANGSVINGANTSGFNTIGTYKFKTPEVTTDTKYTVKFSVSVSKDGENWEDVVNQSTVTVKAKETTPEPTTTKSNNANLSTLGVTPKEYDFTGFNKDKTEYTLPNAIPSDVDKLNVLYKTEDTKAKATVTGNTNLKAGTNTIVVKVTAEDGTTKEYTIKLTKLAEDEEKPGNVIDDADELFLTKLEIEGLEISPTFSKDTFFYKANLKEDKDEVKIIAVANNDKAKITILGNTNLKDGENTINIIISLDGKVEQKVYQITLTKGAEPEEEPLATGGTEIKTAYIGGFERYKVVGLGIIILIILIITILVILIRRELKKNKINYDDYDNDDDEEDIEEVPPLKSRLYNQEDNIDDDEEIEEVPPLKSKLYNQDEDDEEDYRKTIEEINAQTHSIFRKNENVDGQSVEYDDDDFPKERRRRKGKH